MCYVVNKYNPKKILLMQNQAHILSLVKKIMIKYPKFKTGDSLIILKYKNIFAKG